MVLRGGMSVRSITTAGELAGLPDDDFRYELDEGELIRMPPPGEEHGWVVNRLYGRLFNHAANGGFGTTYVETGFLLARDPDVVRAPDIAFLGRERLPAPVDAASGYILGAPDLAIEIQSPSQAPADVDKKVRQYLAAGARAVWVVSPRRRQAAVHRRSENPVTLSERDYLEAPDLLPGLRILLAEILKPA